jgi:primary-amine oxidase
MKHLSLLVLALACLSSPALLARPALTHPLDPLSKPEIESVARILKASGKVPEGSLYPAISLREPPKAEVLAYRPGQLSRREASVVVFDPVHSRTFEAVADLRSSKLVDWKEVPGVQPSITVEELNLVPKIVKADPRWQEAMKKRGITDFEQVMFDPWAPGTLEAGDSPNVRWIRCLSYYKGGKSKNGYARPIEGVIAIVNMNQRKVERLMAGPVHPLPPENADLDRRSVQKKLGHLRLAPKPFKISQPQGPSFTLKGNEVTWQKWHFRFGVHPREGLVLYQVGYEDHGKVRSILYRGSVSEMVVPYGDHDPNWLWRSAFDVGEYGLGKLMSEIQLGSDVPENAKLIDAVQADDFGKPTVYKHAVALYERDGGVLWRHFDFYANQTDSRRARELVLCAIMTVGNYDYSFNWVFKQDGSIEQQIQLTGIMLPKGVDVAKLVESGGDHAHHDAHQAERFWHLVAPYVAAPHHQHFFNFRLDMDVDGPSHNEVGELNVSSLPRGDDNPGDNAFTMGVRTFHNEKDAVRDIDFASARKWLVINPTVRNRLGHPSAYALVPNDAIYPYQHPEAAVRGRAPFMTHHFWATPLDPAQMHAGGEYPNQSVRARDGMSQDGIDRWVSAGRSLDGKDVVLWYTFGVTHIPRPEEWPVMSVTQTGFKLLPVGFFAENPGLDVP